MEVIREQTVSGGPAALCVKNVRVLVVDGHRVVRFGICGLIGAQPGLSVVGDASDSREAGRMLAELRPDIVLLDLDLESEQSGYELIRKVGCSNAGSQVVVYTVHDGEHRVIEAIRCGARGYVIKTARPERVYEAIRVVADGGSYIDPTIASLVMGRIGRWQERRQSNSRELTLRERSVLIGIAAGKRNREIADELYISERTVKYHVKSMFGKLRAKNRAQVVRIALQQGLI